MRVFKSKNNILGFHTQ